MPQHKKTVILYDGGCPICRRQYEFLKKRDRENRLAFANIRSRKFHGSGIHIPIDTLKKKIHAILPDGSIVSGMEVIRTAWREIGLGYLIAPTKWFFLRVLFDRLYDFTAKNRHAVSRFLK